MAILDFIPSARPIMLGKQTAKNTLILLHGLTLSGRQFVPIGNTLLDHLGEDWKIILPTAPIQRVTWLAGQMANAWFDLPMGSFDKNEDKTGLHQAKDYVHRLVDEQMAKGVNPKHIIVGGFSQGGALALLSVLTYRKELGGAVCLSGYLPLADNLPQYLKHRLPVLFAHGTNDVPIPLDLAQHSVQLLKETGCDVELKVYPIGHSIDERELAEMADWVKRL
ncbi:TPA: alpha/beta hydrolase [Mannheimia haemolytica]